jgi:ABC-type amino acid transport substrate-binding protein
MRLTVPALLLGLAMPAAADWPEIQKSGRLRVVVAADEQPEMFNLKPTGEPGFEREMIQAFARLHKLELDVVTVPRYDERIAALDAGRVDVIMGIIRTPEREKLIAFSAETMPTRRVAVNWKPRPPIANAAALKSEKVGLLQGASSWKAATVEAGVPEASIRYYPSLDALFAALGSGEVTASVLSASDLGLARRKHPNLQAGAPVGPTTSAGWGVRKADTALKAALDEYVTSLRKTQTWSRLMVKYFGEETLLVLGKQ